MNGQELLFYTRFRSYTHFKMLKAKGSFTGFSTNDQEKAKSFYTDILGLELDNEEMGLDFRLPGGGRLFIYSKTDHVPATYTVLNFVVENIDEAVDELIEQGVKFDIYEGAHQDEKGIARGIAAKMGPDIAWFKDSAGNIISVLQEK